MVVSMNQCKVCGERIQGRIYGLEYKNMLWCSCEKCKYKLHANLNISADALVISDDFIRNAIKSMRRESERQALIEERERTKEEARIRLLSRADYRYAGTVPKHNIRKVNPKEFEE